MIPNPFIELFRAPVATLVALGYALGLGALLVITLGACWSNFHTARGQYRQYGHQWDYLPPATWVLRVAAIPGILAIDAWALAALVWLLTAP